MRNAFAVLGSLVTLSFVGASALAAGSIGATATPDGRTTIAPAAMKSPVMPSKAQLGVEGFTELYTTFNTDPNNACNTAGCKDGLCNGNGQCGLVAAGTDPFMVCSMTDCRTGMCSGGAACQNEPNGTVCGPQNSGTCLTGNCETQLAPNEPIMSMPR